MKEINSQEEYLQEKQKVLNLFADEEFIMKHLMTDATFRSVVEMLVRDASPYDMIKKLIEERKQLIDKVRELAALIPPQPIRIN